MSFKTYECHTTGLSILPAQFDAMGDTLLVTTDASSGPGFQYDCDPALSKFHNALPVQTGMTQVEFYELWPMLSLIILAGVLFKILHKVLA